MLQLEIKDLHVSIEDKEILKGLSLTSSKVKSMPLWVEWQMKTRKPQKSKVSLPVVYFTYFMYQAARVNVHP